ncbi:MAG: hypothetical protein JW981_10445, partial [Anaerolineae bacterium]|nr:hypothetical protein [Anaerolineae bacterium]
MARLTGTKALAFIAILIVSLLFAAPLVVLATSPTTVEIDGTYDFEVDEVVSGTSGSEWFFTWDDDNFYFGTDNDNIDDN